MLPKNSVDAYAFWIVIMIFAVIIGTVGCYRGTVVKNNSLSIGQETTKSVVYSIFLIIVADALFSILFSAIGV